MMAMLCVSLKSLCINFSVHITPNKTVMNYLRLLRYDEKDNNTKTMTPPLIY